MAQLRRAAFAGLVAMAAGSGCAQFKPPRDTGEEGADEGGGRGRGPGGAACEEKARIEDAEDGDDQIAVVEGRGGYIFTFADEKGSTVLPKDSDDVKVAQGGPDGSEYALRMSGKLADAEDVFAGIGFSFVEPKGPYDASAWKGISFVARTAGGNGVHLRVSAPDGNTDPDGKVCTDCYNDFGVGFEVTEEWTRFVVAFSDLKQEADWGAPRPAAIEPNKLYGLQWQVATRGADYDIWIDDVSFAGCP
jgi:hypothetical protein